MQAQARVLYDVLRTRQTTTERLLARAAIGGASVDELTAELRSWQDHASSVAAVVEPLRDLLR